MKRAGLRNSRIAAGIRGIAGSCGRPGWRTLMLAGGAMATAAPAQDVALCGASLMPLQADGRLLNHFAYAVGPRRDLVRPPRALSGQCELVNQAMRDDLDRLVASARADAQVGRDLIAESCFRSPGHQARLFCRRGGIAALLQQALEIAPPGYSEHSTGFAIDFGERGGKCNLKACFAATATGRWLASNAPAFGFEMSFPQGNRQGVAFEPWHWRWVGRGAAGAAANPTFAIARERFPTDQAGHRAASWMANPTPFAPLMGRRLASELVYYAAHRLTPVPATLAIATSGQQRIPFDIDRLAPGGEAPGISPKPGRR